jgi:hypothetical protein
MPGRVAAVGMNLKKGRERVQAASAARAGPGWADEEPLRLLFYREMRALASQKRIDDLDAIDNAPVLHIF